MTELPLARPGREQEPVTPCVIPMLTMEELQVKCTSLFTAINGLLTALLLFYFENQVILSRFTSCSFLEEVEKSS